MIPALCLILLLGFSCVSAKYTPDWNSLDNRPLPTWFDESKIGIFLHWGVFSVPSFGSEWFWNFWKTNQTAYVNFMKDNYKPGFTYQEFAPQFTAEFFDPDRWAAIFNASGARYIVLTSKHHEGFTLWPSEVSFSWNAKDVGPGRDLVGDLADAVRKYPNLHFGLYHSLFEWFNPIYVDDRNSGFHKQHFIKAKTMPELYELVMRYKPEVLWSDGAGEAHSDYWTSTKFLAWLYNDSPVKDIVVTNDRWGNDTDCKHGGYYSCMDRYNPGKLLDHKWENAMTLDKTSWGFRRNANLKDIMSMDELIDLLAETVSCGGNMLINVGPTHDGLIVPIFEERLTQLGDWLRVNGEAIYSSKPWSHQNDSLAENVWYTSKGDNVYAIVLNWPEGNLLTFGSLNLSEESTITMLGVEGELAWTKIDEDTTLVQFPTLTPDMSALNWAWTLRITGSL